MCLAFFDFTDKSTIRLWQTLGTRVDMCSPDRRNRTQKWAVAPRAFAQQSACLTTIMSRGRTYNFSNRVCPELFINVPTNKSERKFNFHSLLENSRVDCT